MDLLKPESIFQTNNYTLTIIKFIGKGKSGYSYLAREGEQNFVIKIMHDEKCTYYNFQNGKVQLEIDAYKTLSLIDIPLPKLIDYSIEKRFLLKEFINGDLASELISKEKITSAMFKQLFTISNKLIKEELNIDYFPNNFVIKDGELVYIDYEVNRYDSKWDLTNWGIFYWLNSEGFKKFLEFGDANYINSDLESGIPIKEPFIKKANELIEKYSQNRK